MRQINEDTELKNKNVRRTHMPFKKRATVYVFFGGAVLLIYARIIGANSKKVRADNSVEELSKACVAPFGKARLILSSFFLLEMLPRALVSE